MKKSTPKVTALSKWERDLLSNDKNYFKQIKFMCKETNLKSFTSNSLIGYLSPKKNFTSLVYRITRTVPTAASQIRCHTFIDCHLSKQFFHKVLKHFNEENATSFTQSDELSNSKVLKFHF